MRIIEQQLAPKTDSAHCEDALVVTDNYAAVIDGATTNNVIDGVAPGRAARDAIAAAVTGLDPEATAREAIDMLSSAVRTLGIDNASAAVAILSLRRRECWVVGDCVAVDVREAIGVLNPQKPIDAVAADVRACAIAALGETAERVQAARSVIAPILRRQRELRNADGPWAYGAIDGSPVPDPLLTVTALRPDAREVVLHTDGYPWTHPSLDAAERALAVGLAEDPLCIDQLLGTKAAEPGRSFDDRAYLRIALDRTRHRP